MSPAPTRRVNRGKGHSYYIDGDKVPGITTILGKGFPKDALIGWAADESAKYAVNHWDELAQLPVADRLEPIKRARYEASSEAKIRGTEVHELAHRLTLGEEVDVPDDRRDLVDAALAFLDDWEVRELMVEEPVYSRRHGYAGTPDLIAILGDGQTWLLDYKTGAKARVYLEHVLQLAAARYADFAMLDGREVPVPKVDKTGIVLLKSDGYELVPVEADERAFWTFRCVKWLAGYVEADRDAWIRDPLSPPARQEA